MSVFFEIGRLCAATRPAVAGHEKQAFGGALGNAAGKFFKFVGGHPRLAGGLGLGTAVGAAGLNEAAAGHNLPHFGGTADRPLWHPGSHNLSLDPHTQGIGTSAWRALTRPIQTFRSMTGSHPQLSRESMLVGSIKDQQLKFNPKTGRFDVTGGSYDLHPLFRQQLEQIQRQNAMFGQLDPGFAEFLGLAKAEAAAPQAAPGASPAAAAPAPQASPAATPPSPKVPEVVRNAFGPLHMNDYTKVPNVPLPSMF